MWLWLQNNNKYNLKTFFKKIFVVSLLIHLVLLIFFLFIIKDKSLNLDIFLNKDLITHPPVPVIFLPFAKNIPGSIEQLKKLSKKSRGGKNAQKAKSSKKPIIIKQVKNTQKKIIIAKQSKKNIKTEPIKKAKEIKKEIPVKPPEVIKEIEKPEPLKVEPPPQIDIPIEETVKLPIEDILPIQENLLNEPVAIYLGAKDMQGYQLVVAIQSEILRYWKPPMGLPKNIECKVNIKVDKDGRVEDFKIEKSSNVLAYDISLRNAILKSIMPNEVRGRDFVLTLNC